jgi:hypothetical protein
MKTSSEVNAFTRSRRVCFVILGEAGWGALADDRDAARRRKSAGKKRRIMGHTGLLPPRL